MKWICIKYKKKKYCSPSKLHWAEIEPGTSSMRVQCTNLLGHGTVLIIDVEISLYLSYIENMNDNRER